MSTPFLTTISAEVAEKVTVRITGTIKDHTDTAIPAASLSTLTLTLYEKKSGTIINTRSAANVLNTGGGTVTSGGVLTMVLDPADNALVTQAPATEVHVALFEWTYNSGAAAGRALVEFTVSNFLKVT